MIVVGIYCSSLALVLCSWIAHAIYVVLTCFDKELVLQQVASHILFCIILFER